MAETLNERIEMVRIGGLDVEVRRWGRGRPLLFLHGEFGLIGGCQRLAEGFEVIAPSLPGFGGSTRPDWIMSVRDYAAWTTWFAREIGLREPVDLVATSMGGWIASEIATIAPQFIRRLVLLGPMGVKPERGEIFDYFLESGVTGIRRAFLAPDDSPVFRASFGKELTPEESDRIEQHREMTCRVAWKPYMHSLTLPALLGGVVTPTLIVWGRDDAIIPVSTADQWRRAIPQSRLSVVERCGHMPEVERPDELAALANGFLQDGR